MVKSWQREVCSAWEMVEQSPFAPLDASSTPSSLFSRIATANTRPVSVPFLSCSFTRTALYGSHHIHIQGFLSPWLWRVSKVTVTPHLVWWHDPISPFFLSSPISLYHKTPPFLPPSTASRKFSFSDIAKDIPAPAVSSGYLSLSLASSVSLAWSHHPSLPSSASIDTKLTQMWWGGCLLLLLLFLHLAPTFPNIHVAFPPTHI